MYRPFSFWNSSDKDKLRYRKVLSKSLPKAPKTLQAIFGDCVVVFNATQVDGLDVPASKMNDAYFGSVFAVLGEAKEFTPDNGMLLCAAVDPKTYSTASVVDYALCKMVQVGFAYSDVVQSLRNQLQTTRVDVELAISAAVGRQASRVVWLCSREEAPLVSPIVNMKGDTPAQFFGSFTGFLTDSIVSHVDLPRLRGEHLLAAESEQFTPFGSMP